METMETIEIKKTRTWREFLQVCVNEAFRKGMSCITISIQAIDDTNRDECERKFRSHYPEWSKIIVYEQNGEEIVPTDKFICKEELAAIIKKEDYIANCIIIEERYNWEVVQVLAKVYKQRKKSKKLTYKHKHYPIAIPQYVSDISDELQRRFITNSLLALDQKKLSEVIGKRMEEYDAFINP